MISVSVGGGVLVGNRVVSDRGVGVHVGGSCSRVGVGLGTTIVGGRVGNGNGFNPESGLA